MVVATIGWGLSTALTRAILEDGVKALALVPVRMVFALITLVGVVAISPRFQNSGAPAWKRGATLGTVSVMGPIVLSTMAFEFIPVSIGGLLIALIPISTILAAHFIVDDERFNARSLPGLLISLVGSVVLVGIGGNEVEGVTDLWRGVGLMVAGVLLAGIGGALSRRFAREVKAESLVLPQFATGTVLALALLPLLPAQGLTDWTGGNWALAVAIGVFGTAIPHSAFLVGASVNSATRLALTGYAVPVVAIALAVVFIGEELTLSIVVGAVLIIGGVVLVESATPHQPEPGMATAR